MPLWVYCAMDCDLRPNKKEKARGIQAFISLYFPTVQCDQPSCYSSLMKYPSRKARDTEWNQPKNRMPVLQMVDLEEWDCLNSWSQMITHGLDSGLGAIGFDAQSSEVLFLLWTNFFLLYLHSSSLKGKCLFNITIYWEYIICFYLIETQVRLCP